MPSANPFLRYRERLDSYAAARAGGFDDAWFVDLVTRLDDAVAAVDGHGFTITPAGPMPELARAAGIDATLVVKVEVDNVGGSHKARHLFGVALALAVQDAVEGREGSDPTAAPLAIASCGNAAVGAAVIARAVQKPLRVFVPAWADPAVLERLDELDADVTVCERRPGESGDPCYLRFGEAVAHGARPFSVQGTDTAGAFDGGRTLGWELAEQAPGLDAVYVQVGGGALATAVSMGLGDGVTLWPVQAEGCAPLRRAWDRLAPEFDLAAAAASPDDYMWPWDEPTSAADGILDDITYDWLPLLERTLATGGEPLVAPESSIVRAHELAAATGVPVSVTGSAGLAGVLTRPPEPGSTVAVLFTGRDRHAGNETSSAAPGAMTENGHHGLYRDDDHPDRGQVRA